MDGNQPQSPLSKSGARWLLDALRDSGALKRFIPFDVDPSVLRDAAAALQEGDRVRVVAADAPTDAADPATSKELPGRFD